MVFPDTTKEVSALVVSDFELEKQQEFIDISSQDILHERLAQVIGHLLHHDYGRLLNAMYRLDISEKKFNDVITGYNGKDIANKLADLVIQRELEKVKTRLKYRDFNTSKD